MKQGTAWVRTEEAARLESPRTPDKGGILEDMSYDDYGKHFHKAVSSPAQGCDSLTSTSPVLNIVLHTTEFQYFWEPGNGAESAQCFQRHSGWYLLT